MQPKSPINQKQIQKPLQIRNYAAGFTVKQNIKADDSLTHMAKVHKNDYIQNVIQEVRKEQLVKTLF